MGGMRGGGEGTEAGPEEDFVDHFRDGGGKVVGAIFGVKE